MREIRTAMHVLSRNIKTDILISFTQQKLSNFLRVSKYLYGSMRRPLQKNITYISKTTPLSFVTR